MYSSLSLMGGGGGGGCISGLEKCKLEGKIMWKVEIRGYKIVERGN